MNKKRDCLKISLSILLFAIIIFSSILIIPYAKADVQSGCCINTTAGKTCQDYIELGDCQTNMLRTDKVCSDAVHVPECQIGTCKRLSGPCSPLVKKYDCGPTWVPEKDISQITECQEVCCSIHATQCSVMPSKMCDEWAARNYPSITPDKSAPTSEGTCASNICGGQQMGCCILEGGHCQYKTKQWCDGQKALSQTKQGLVDYFKPNAICSSLTTECSAQSHESKGCVYEGTTQKICWFDSDGNQEECPTEDNCGYPNGKCEPQCLDSNCTDGIRFNTTTGQKIVVKIGEPYCKERKCVMNLGPSQTIKTDSVIDNNGNLIEWIGPRTDAVLWAGKSMCHNFFSASTGNTVYDDLIGGVSEGLVNEELHCLEDYVPKATIVAGKADRSEICIFDPIGVSGQLKNISNNIVDECRVCGAGGNAGWIGELFGIGMMYGKGIAGNSVCNPSDCNNIGVANYNYNLCVYHRDWRANSFMGSGSADIGSCDPRYPPGSDDKCSQCGEGGDSIWNSCNEKECLSLGNCKFRPIDWNSQDAFIKHVGQLVSISYIERVDLIPTACIGTAAYKTWVTGDGDSFCSYAYFIPFIGGPALVTACKIVIAPVWFYGVCVAEDSWKYVIKIPLMMAKKVLYQGPQDIYNFIKNLLEKKTTAPTGTGESPVKPNGKEVAAAARADYYTTKATNLGKKLDLAKDGLGKTGYFDKATNTFNRAELDKKILENANNPQELKKLKGIEKDYAKYEKDLTKQTEYKAQAGDAKPQADAAKAEAQSNNNAIQKEKDKIIKEFREDPANVIAWAISIAYGLVVSDHLIGIEGKCDPEPVLPDNQCKKCNNDDYRICTEARCLKLGPNCHPLADTEIRKAGNYNCQEDPCTEGGNPPVIKNISTSWFVDTSSEVTVIPNNNNTGTGDGISLTANVPWNTSNLKLSIYTDSRAECRWSDAPSQDFANMHNSSETIPFSGTGAPYQHEFEIPFCRRNPQNNQETCYNPGSKYTIILKCKNVCRAVHQPGDDHNYININISEAPDWVAPKIVEPTDPENAEWIPNTWNTVNITFTLDKNGPLSTDADHDICKFSNNDSKPNWTEEWDEMIPFNGFSNYEKGLLHYSYPGTQDYPSDSIIAGYCRNDQLCSDGRMKCAKCVLMIDLTKEQGFSNVNWDSIRNDNAAIDCNEFGGDWKTQCPKLKEDSETTAVLFKGNMKTFQLKIKCQNKEHTRMLDVYSYKLIVAPPYNITILKPGWKESTYNKHPVISVNTSEITICRYSINDTTMPWAQMTPVDVGLIDLHEGTMSQTLSGLPEGREYNITIACQSAGKMEFRNTTIVYILKDMTSPIITRNYYRSSTGTGDLIIVTNEKSTCRYSYDSSKKCAFNYSSNTESSKLSGEDSLYHSQPWAESNTYYIKCADEEGNLPGGSEDANSCTIVKPFKTTTTSVSFRTAFGSTFGR